MVIRYISDVGRKNLHSYKYQGSDNSYSYNYFLSPIAEYFVKFVPLWVAPNLITYMGHLSSLMLYILPLNYCGLSLNCKIPEQVTLICCVFYFLWMLLDNIDGKQARRTRNSTPLGLIFDHQVDAVCVTITTTCIGMVSLYGSSLETLVIWVIGAIPFYLATWEELYVGVQNFPVINGPSDGCLLIGFLLVVFGIWTPEYFWNTYYNNLPYMTYMYYFFLVGSIAVGLYSVLVVLMKSSKKLEAFLTLRGFFMFYVTIAGIYYFSCENLVVTASRELMLMLGFCFAREILYIQLAHVTDTDYRPLWFLNGFILSAPCVVALGNHFFKLAVPEYPILVFLAVLAGLGYFHMAYTAANEIASELKINIFRINKVKSN